MKKRIIRKTKKDYLNGTISLSDVIKILSKKGISQEKIRKYLDDWGTPKFLTE